MIRYMFVYVLVAISFLVYLSDIYTAATMISSQKWSGSIFNKCNSANGDCIVIDFKIGRWIFVGCVAFSFLLVCSQPLGEASGSTSHRPLQLAYEGWKAKKIILSRDISYAFTNVMANSFYSLSEYGFPRQLRKNMISLTTREESYDHFCFFSQIENSTKKKDDFAFFVFFTFKGTVSVIHRLSFRPLILRQIGWKRLLLADGPRQSINALTLYSFWVANGKGWPTNIRKYTDGSFITTVLLFTIVFTVVVFLVSLVILVIAGICYIPLLIYIQGNLKVTISLLEWVKLSC